MGSNSSRGRTYYDSLQPIIGYRVSSLLSRSSGIFRVYSIHESSINFDSESLIISLSLKRASPYTIMLSDRRVFRYILETLKDHVASNLKIVLTSKTLKIYDYPDNRLIISIPLSSYRIYDRRRDIDRYRAILHTLPWSADIVNYLRKVFNIILVMLTNTSYIIKDSTIIDLFNKCQNTIQHCWRSIKQLAGLGLGLTPEGDDIIMGFLSSVSLVGDSLKRIIGGLDELCRYTAKLSCSMFKASLNLDLYDEELEYLLALIKYLDNPEESFNNLYNSLINLSRVGSSSGLMFSAGSIYGFISSLSLKLKASSF